MITPFEGIRVLDFTHALAGPYCTMLMAQYGAEVFKLESPGGGDIGRGWGPPFTDGQASFFLGLNPGKQGICIDLKRPEGLELCLSLIEKMDVLIENFRPGALDRLGLGYEKTSSRNPRLIYCSISGYGQDGPSREEPAMDLIVQAASGLISITGTAAGEQVRCGHSVADTTAGLFALIGIQMALRVRESTGHGQFVDVSMLDGLVSTMASSFANYVGSGTVPRPMGTAFASIVPYRTFPTADREIALAIGSEKLWGVFCKAIGWGEAAKYPEYASNALRVRNRQVLEPLLIDLFRTATADEWVRRLSAVGIPCAAVKKIDEVVASPQVAARGMFPFAPVTGPPVKLSETPGTVRSAAPQLGEHSRTALHQLLGLSDAELDRLTEGAILFHSR